MTRNGQPDADDLFAETRMSFGDHIEDLRTHLWRAVIGFGVAILLSFTFSWFVLGFIKSPVEKALGEFQQRRWQKQIADLEKNPDPKANQPKEVIHEVRPSDLARALRALVDQLPEPGAAVLDKEELKLQKVFASLLAKRFPDDKKDEALIPFPLLIRPSDSATPLIRPGELVVLSITEGMMVWLEVSLLCGLVLGSPWIFYQLWSFVAAGLYANEKKLVHLYMPFSLVLFLCGVFLCEIVVIPQAVRFLLEFDEWLGVDANLRLEDWLSFALMMPVIFGISFQTPLIMLFLAKIGIFDAASFRAKRRIAWFVLAVSAALIMPTTDIYTIFMMQIPLIGLYEFGILLAAWVGKKQTEEEVPDPEEMVGV